jgi:hypothetical protein
MCRRGHRAFFRFGEESCGKRSVNAMRAGSQPGRWLRAEERISNPASSGALSCSRASRAGWLELSSEAM